MNRDLTTPAVDAFLWVGRLLVGGVLIYAGFSKALAPAAEFAAALANYKLFPSTALLPMAAVVPWLEIWTGLFLLAGLYTEIAGVLAACLFLGFLTVLTTAKVRHIDLASCGCFGAETFSPKTTFQLDAVLLILAILLAYFSRRPRRWTFDRWL